MFVCAYVFGDVCLCVCVFDCVCVCLTPSLPSAAGMATERLTRNLHTIAEFLDAAAASRGGVTPRLLVLELLAYLLGVCFVLCV